MKYKINELPIVVKIEDITYSSIEDMDGFIVARHGKYSLVNTHNNPSELNKIYNYLLDDYIHTDTFSKINKELFGILHGVYVEKSSLKYVTFNLGNIEDTIANDIVYNSVNIWEASKKKGSYTVIDSDIRHNLDGPAVMYHDVPGLYYIYGCHIMSKLFKDHYFSSMFYASQKYSEKYNPANLNEIYVSIFGEKFSPTDIPANIQINNLIIGESEEKFL